MKTIKFVQKICEEMIYCTSVITTGEVHNAHNRGIL